MLRSGRLIVFEGADGVGKSELSSRVASAIDSAGMSTHLLSFPGRQQGTVGNLVYRIHHCSEALGISALSPASLQTLHVAAHLDAIETNIIPMLERGECVVLDRFWWSTWVYGAVAGVSREILDALIALEDLAWRGWKPSLAFHVRRRNPLRDEASENWNQLVATYVKLVEEERGNYPIVELWNDSTIEETLKEALAQLQPIGA